jgi:hypothetical protein
MTDAEDAVWRLGTQVNVNPDAQILRDHIDTLTRERDEAEKRLRYIVWYAVNVYDDKPHQFWNQVRLAAEHVADTESAAVINDYYENGCPFRRERDEARETVLKAAERWANAANDEYDITHNRLMAALRDYRASIPPEDA